MDVLSDFKPYRGPRVTFPDNSKIFPAKQGSVPLSNKLSTAAKTAINLPRLKSSFLIVVGSICDDKNIIVFDDKEVKALEDSPTLRSVIQNSEVIL